MSLAVTTPPPNNGKDDATEREARQTFGKAIGILELFNRGGASPEMSITPSEQMRYESPRDVLEPGSPTPRGCPASDDFPPPPARAPS